MTHPPASTEPQSPDQRSPAGSGHAIRTGPSADPDAGGLAALVAAREEKAARLRRAGLDPYPARVQRTHTVAQAAATFVELEGRDALDALDDVQVVGRLFGARRLMGGAAFVHLMDGSGRIQLHLRRDQMGQEEFDRFKADFDPGDFVSAAGRVFRTRTGEVTLSVSRLGMLAKSLLPLPEKWRGLRDVETRFRKRYLDLVASEDVRARFRKRSLVLHAMRAYLDDHGFLEVETPVLQPIYGGGAAEPFETWYNALQQTMFLRIADELYLKRLLVGGFERVYEVAKDFRNEGIDRTHLPEFTQMECYWAYADYRDMMALTEDMVAAVARQVNGTTVTEIDGRSLDLAPPWPRMTVREALRQATGIDIEEHADLGTLRAAIAAAGLAADPQPTWAKTVDELLGEHVEPTLWSPTFLVDYPVDLSPLAKRSPVDMRYVERFEPFAAGFELGNAFSELNDPVDQRLRFEEMARQLRAGDAEAHPLDEDFLEALMYGMPPTAGLGIGVDRLVMLLVGESNIREVVLFPQLRHRSRESAPEMDADAEAETGPPEAEE